MCLGVEPPAIDFPLLTKEQPCGTAAGDRASPPRAAAKRQPQSVVTSETGDLDRGGNRGWVEVKPVLMFRRARSLRIDLLPDAFEFYTDMGSGSCQGCRRGEACAPPACLRLSARSV